MFNVIQFYKNYHITPVESGKHYRSGWVNIDCPFCKGKDGHLGIHISTGAVKCWKCGKHSQTDVIKALLNCDFPTAKDIQEEYTEQRRLKHTEERTRRTHKRLNRTCEYPTGTTAMTDRHRAYLRGRGFDAEHLEKVWGLLGTGNMGAYKFRIIAPILVDGCVVSYQGRDVTGKSPLRYKACVQENEVIEHQTTVYGLDLVKGDKCVLVEGIADCWRLGPGAVSCFGTSFLLAQVNLLADRFRVCYVLFDSDDDNAIKMAEQLACLLSARGVETEILELDEGDPGDMKQEDANKLMKELGFL